MSVKEPGISGKVAGCCGADGVWRLVVGAGGLKAREEEQPFPGNYYPLPEQYTQEKYDLSMF